MKTTIVHEVVIGDPITDEQREKLYYILREGARLVGIAIIARDVTPTVPFSRFLLAGREPAIRASAGHPR